jgi:hypothetical protein
VHQGRAIITEQAIQAWFKVINQSILNSEGENKRFLAEFIHI